MERASDGAAFPACWNRNVVRVLEIRKYVESAGQQMIVVDVEMKFAEFRDVSQRIH